MLQLLTDPKAYFIMQHRPQVASVYGDGATFRFFIEAVPIPSPGRTQASMQDSPEMLKNNSMRSSNSYGIPQDIHLASPLQYEHSISNSAVLELMLKLLFSILITEDNLINQVSGD